MRISWNKYLNNLCGRYLDSLSAGYDGITGMAGDVKRLTGEFIKDIDCDNPDKDFTALLKTYVAANEIHDISLLFEGRLRSMADYLLGEEWAGLFCRYIKILAECPYTEGWLRRSQRSHDIGLHINGIRDILAGFVRLRACGLSTTDILRGGRSVEEIKELENELDYGLDGWLAAKIDSGDRECMDFLAEAMTSENNFNRIGYAHFRAIAKSGNEELLELEGRLLLAARLQEGLRQAIVETMDAGRPNSFIYILGIIRENNLHRFASVKRGLAVATGLGEQDAPERITDKFVELVYRYVSEPDEAVKAVGSDDAMKVYLALWAVGFYDVQRIAGLVKELILSAPAYKVEAAMLMLGCTQSDRLNSELASLAIHRRLSDHGVVAGALSYYISDYGFNLYLYNAEPEWPALDRFFKSKEEAVSDFHMLSELHDSIASKETFDPYVFPWLESSLSRGDVADRICKIALMVGDSGITDLALGYIDSMEPYMRACYIKALLLKPQSRRQVEVAVERMADRGAEARSVACDIVVRLHKEGMLTDGDYRMMIEHLRLKAAEMRVTVIKIFGSLPDAKAESIVKELLADKSADRRLAGLDILKNWSDKGERRELLLSLLPSVVAIGRPTVKEKVLIDALADAESMSKPSYTLSNGFGLYDPRSEMDIHAESRLGLDGIGRLLRFDNPGKTVEIIDKIRNLIGENADYEYVNSSGDNTRFGNNIYYNRWSREGLKCLALPDKWRQFYESEISTPENMLRLYVAVRRLNPNDAPFSPIIEKLLGHDYISTTIRQKYDKPYINDALASVETLFEEFGCTEYILDAITDVVAYVAVNLDPEDAVRKYKRYPDCWHNETYVTVYSVEPLDTLLGILRNFSDRCPDDIFARSFAARYILYRKTGFVKGGATVSDMEYLRAWKMGIITDEDVWREMMGREHSAGIVEGLTGRLPGGTDRYGSTRKKHLTHDECVLVERAVSRILDIELKRGDTPTEVSPLAESIRCVKGIGYLVEILKGLGKDKPSIYGAAHNKRNMFSHLLRSCSPADHDTAKELRTMARKAGITAERLVEAAMFSPRWLEIVEEATGWKGLTCGVYYFLAHTGEQLDDRSKSYIARYSSVTPEDFADGAFDPAWFREAYTTLGRKRFETVYEAAGYVSEGNRHTRARKLSDAALGILRPKSVRKEIVAKRNKNLVVAYGLIPLGRNRLADLRERYAFLNQFLKESRLFGAQRQAGESRAVKLALDNLARTAGYGDATRLTWSMEADLIKEVAGYLSPNVVDDVTVYISIGDDRPEIVMESRGHRLQSMPSRIKKDRYIISLREIYGRLKDQHVRGRALLEQTMVESSEFTASEILRLHDNPVIWGMLSRLVLVSDAGDLGFPGEDGATLVGAGGNVTVLNNDDRVRIAHPYDLYISGCWNEYQTCLFERRWRQPFKQIFRELYVPTSEEAAQPRSMRYSGNQIMPARTAALLKKRGWTVDYSNGLQKVCFHGDVTAVIYAMADWFSPSDIEAPTLEYVSFYERRSFRDKKIGDVLPRVFSEIMRDVDLAVSVAHVGGVDPETSHSTIEMRRAIVEHALPMFGIGNVVVSGNFAKIKGTYGCYNIHLGSGVIHREGGAQIAVLPVHSQARGRIFLPFLDEDPKTAEIISKILLFAEDTKIKDPMILSQLG